MTSNSKNVKGYKQDLKIGIKVQKRSKTFLLFEIIYFSASSLKNLPDPVLLS